MIYEGDPLNQVPVVASFLVDGLRHGMRGLYIGPAEIVAAVDSALSARHVDVTAEKQRGALLFLSDSDPSACFEPQALIDRLSRLIDDALAAGFSGLCATGDIALEVGNEAGFAKLCEYERMLERLFLEKPLQGICLYRSGGVPPEALLDALLTHRSVVTPDHRTADNYFFLPAEGVGVSAPDRDKQCDWLCQQIMRVQRAEQARDRAQAAQRDLEREQARRRAVAADVPAALQQRAREIESLSYGLAHDLRAPLRHINYCLQQLSALPAPDATDATDATAATATDGTDWLERIRTSTAQMSALINGVMALATAKERALDAVPVNLSELAVAVIENLRREAPAREVRCAISPGLIAFGEPSLLLSVLQNLVGNAWKFTSKRAQAEIGLSMLRVEGGLGVFCISDNGVGFDPAAAKRLFGPLQRLHAQREFPGTGLGLATVRHIVERHGGQVWAEGAIDGGARFCFSLPVGAPAAKPTPGPTAG